MGILIKEQWVTNNISMGDSDVYETGASTPLELFKNLKKTCGKCINKMYIDNNNTFQHWVSVHKKQDLLEKHSYYVDLKGDFQ